ncbi:type I polyketide synthase, partial [Streptomyces smyrnaeus]|uniref:type I polyketide synthase n=1 Tax=Streptomyces smyrnaeus TaxID=1387713 RepID=UPI0036CAC220
MANNEEKLLDYLKRATTDLRTAQRRLKEVEAAGREPIAIVGMACRFPGGVRSPEELWDLVARGGDAIGGLPEDRNWDLEALYDPDPQHPGTSNTTQGGFLDDVAGFDAAFFGISPREAIGMAPQQRLALEACWEAIEHAGIDPQSLRGSRTGTFIGCDHLDYYSDPSQVPDGSAGYFTIGNTASVVSGRVAYLLGLQGAAVTVDTACSSASVALHLASRSLRQSECSLALAGGVAVMSSSAPFVGFADLGVLAPDGRSKAFSAHADGMTMSEGVGILLLERLSDARRNGHQVLAVIRGSAINQDGTSNGLTAPNGPAQQRVITEALADARLTAADVDTVEAHGTGTTLGDPIEAQALLATYGRERPEGRPLWLGSVKSNIGHTQMAAGAAGVIKMVLAMRHGTLPASLHLSEPTPEVDWSSGAVELLTEPRDWPRGEGPRRAGVSSFGISGTNAHLILEEADEEEPSSPAHLGSPPSGHASERAAEVMPWVLSGRTADALRGQARRLADWLATDPAPGPGPGPDAQDVGWSLATTRSVFEQRAVVLGAGGEEMLAGVRALAAGEPHPSVISSGQAPGGGLVWLFSGQGSQRVGMGAELYARFPVFAEAFDQVCGLLDPQLGVSLREVVFEGSAERLEHTTCAQAGLFALQVGLARLLGSFGVRPDAVVGHSIGEVTAAYVAGVFSLEDACTLVAARATLMGALPEGGAMVAVEAGAEELDLPEGVAVAALNTPTSTVISGPEEPVLQLAAEWKARGRKAKRLSVSHAFHSPLMEPMLEDFRRAVEGLDYQPPSLPLISNLTGRPADERITTPGYWCEHIRQPVHFAPALTHLGTHTYLELGPDPVLTTATQHTLDSDPLTVPLLTAKQPETRAFAHALAQLHTHGHDIDWIPWFPPGPTVDLPTYAFQRERYWLDGTGSGTGDAVGLGMVASGHPLLGGAMEVADESNVVLTGRVAASGEQRWLADHQVLGSVLVPGAAMAEWALCAADEVGCGGVEELVLQAPLVLPENGAVNVQVLMEAATPDGRRRIRIYARPVQEEHDANGWLCHAEGTLGPRPAAESASDGESVWPPSSAEPVDIDGFYERAAAFGYGYGPAFQGVRAVWRDGHDGRELLAEVELPEAAGGPEGFGIHPALLDAALHPGLLLTEAPDDDRAWLPFAWNGVVLRAADATTVRVRITAGEEGAQGERSLRVSVTDPLGAPVLSVDSLVLYPVEAERLRAADRDDGRALFALDWVPLADDANVVPGPAAGEDWAVLGTDPLPAPMDSGPTATGYADLDALVTALDAGAAAPPVVLAGVEPAGDGLETTQHVLALLRGWLAEARLADSRLVVVTRGAVDADDGDADPAGAAVWGLVRSAQVEEPDRFVLLDLGDGAEVDTAIGAVRSALAADRPQVAVRDGRVLVPRLSRGGESRRRGPDELPPKLDPHGTVLITGGTGTVGGLVAEHLVRSRGVGHLVLVGRRGPEAPGARDLAERLTGLGADVRLVAVDVADAGAVDELVAGIDPAHPLTGVVHAAGVLDDAVLSAQSPERLARVWAPKAAGALNLHRATADLPLSMFVLFSSAAACLGNGGQANYTAANAFCDALAAHRRAAGQPGVSVGWGLWDEASGMTGHLTEADRARLSRSGSMPLTTEQALALLELALRHGDPYLLAAHLNRRALVAFGGGGAASGPQRRAAARETGGAGGAAVGTELADRLAELEETGRLEVLLGVVADCAAGALGHRSADELRVEASFKDLGFDSLTAVELRNRLSAATGVRLPATLVFDYPTPQALAGYLVTRLSDAYGGPGAAGRSAARAAVGAPAVAADDEPIAIVSMAGRYPGGVGSPEDLWDLVASGRDAIGAFPDDRGWDLAGLFHPDPDHPGTSYASEGGFVRDAAAFDAAFFGVNPREALAMDPQQRLLLETAWQVLERAGIKPGTLKGSRTGVYAGVMYHDYAVGAAGADAQLEGYAMLAGSGSVVSGRVAYTLGLEGPTMTVDTACSSSLVAMHLAA